MEQPLKTVDIAFPQSWEEFAKEHEAFLDKMPVLMQTFMDALNASCGASGKPNLIVFYLSILAIEDFNEIQLLVGHGYGLGGLKLLRGLYERCITQRYLSKHPGEVQAFLDYYFVNSWKLFTEAQRAYKAKFKFPGLWKRNIEANYKKLARDFRKQSSWTTKSNPRIALEAGGGLEKLYFNCFLRPTMLAHATQTAVLDRLLEEEDGKYAFNSASQRDAIDEALSLTHCLIFEVLQTHNQHFSLALDEKIKICAADFHEVWQRKPTQPMKI